MKVLVINLMQIGDLVLTTPVFRAIKTAHPDFFLAAAVNRDFADLVKFNPFINRLFTVDKRSLKSVAQTAKRRQTLLSAQSAAHSLSLKGR